MITKLVTRGLRATDRDLELDRLNLALGPVGSGKSSILDALRFAFLGHVPQVGKRESDTAKLARDNDLTVELELDEGRSLVRRLRRKPAGRGKTPGLTQDVEASWLPPRTGATEAAVTVRSLVGASDAEAAECLDLRTLLGCSPNERARRIEQLLDASGISAGELQARGAGLLVCRLAEIPEARIPEDAAKLAAASAGARGLLPEGVATEVDSVLAELAAMLGRGIAVAIDEARERKLSASRECRDATAARAKIEEELGDSVRPAEALADLEARKQRASDAAAAARRDLERAQSAGAERQKAEQTLADLQEIERKAAEALEAARSVDVELEKIKAQTAEIVDPPEIEAPKLVDPDPDQLAEATRLRAEAEAIADPAPVPAPIYDVAAPGERVRELQQSARDLTAKADAIVIPAEISTEPQVQACARAEQALNLARQNPWREVETIADEEEAAAFEDTGPGDTYSQMVSTRMARLRGLAALHGGNTEQLEAALLTAGKALKEAERAAAARLIERETATTERTSLREQAKAAETEAAKLQAAAVAELKTANEAKQKTYNEAVAAAAKARNAATASRVEIRTRAKAIEDAAIAAAKTTNDAAKKADLEARANRNAKVAANAQERQALAERARKLESDARLAKTAHEKAAADVRQAAARIAGMQSGAIDTTTTQATLETAELELQEIEPKREELAGAVALEIKMRDLSRQIDRETALVTCWTAAEWAAKRLRDEDQAARSKGLEARMRQFLRGAGRVEDPFLRSGSEFGWVRDGLSVSVEALSGGETVLYCAALAASIIAMRGARERLLLVEAAELGIEAAQQVLAGSAAVAEEWGLQVLVATCAPVEAPAGWQVIECGAAAGAAA